MKLEEYKIKELQEALLRLKHADQEVDEVKAILNKILKQKDDWDVSRLKYLAIESIGEFFTYGVK